MTWVLGTVLIILWLWALRVLDKAGLRFWRYITGASGLFLIIMIMVRPFLTIPLARAVAAIAGTFGKITGFYEAYYRYGVIFIDAVKGAITVNIDLECSGIIEIAAFLSLLVFFSVYTIPERIYVGIIGVIWTLMSNALRITVICTMIHFLGTDYYYLAHTFVGRIVFYIGQVLMYFFVFTKPQIIRMKTGGFDYSKKPGESTAK